MSNFLLISKYSKKCCVSSLRVTTKWTLYYVLQCYQKNQICQRRKQILQAHLPVQKTECTPAVKPWASPALESHSKVPVQPTTKKKESWLAVSLCSSKTFCQYANKQLQRLKLAPKFMLLMFYGIRCEMINYYIIPRLHARSQGDHPGMTTANFRFTTKMWDKDTLVYLCMMLNLIKQTCFKENLMKWNLANVTTTAIIWVVWIARLQERGWKFCNHQLLTCSNKVVEDNRTRESPSITFPWRSVKVMWDPQSTCLCFFFALPSVPCDIRTWSINAFTVRVCHVWPSNSKSTWVLFGNSTRSVMQLAPITSSGKLALLCDGLLANPNFLLTLRSIWKSWNHNHKVKTYDQSNGCHQEVRHQIAKFTVYFRLVRKYLG